MKKLGNLECQLPSRTASSNLTVWSQKQEFIKKNGDDYDINVRFNEANRYDQNALYNQNIIFRDPANGQIKEIPVSALIERKKTVPVLTLSSTRT